MQTTITQQDSPVEYALEITATADELAPRLKTALRDQQKRTQMKGFRVGKVPIQLVKKMFGEALAFQLAEETVQNAYTTEVLDKDEHDVLGQPTITDLDYEMDGDLRAVVRFGVRPEVELQDLSGQQVDVMVHDVTDEEVDEEIERLRERHADLVPVDDEAITEEHLIQFDLQELDLETDTPIIGQKDEDQEFFLGTEGIEERPLLSAIKAAVLGAKVGDAVRFTFEHDAAHGHEAAHVHPHRFLVTIKEVKRRELPELDDAFVGDVTDDELSSMDELRDEIRRGLTQNWEREMREYRESQLIKKMLELHPVPVPQSVVDLYLDSYVEDVKQRNKGEMPPNFDEKGFREANRDDAEEQARWMLIRDKVIEANDLSVTEEELDAHFEEQVGDSEEITVTQMRGFYQQMGLMDNVRNRMLSEKVFDTLAEQFEIVEKDIDTLQAEAEARRAEAETEEAE